MDGGKLVIYGIDMVLYRGGYGDIQKGIIHRKRL